MSGAQLPASAVLTEAVDRTSGQNKAPGGVRLCRRRGPRPPVRKDLDGTQLRGCEEEKTPLGRRRCGSSGRDFRKFIL